MRVLIVKTSSLGDIVHTLPAVTDARRALPFIKFDWVAEEAFAEIPGWHPAVVNVIPVAIRRWRKSVMTTLWNGEWRRFKQRLREQPYDLIIDAQGLIKSAQIARRAHAPIAGLDKHSAREPFASLSYQRKFTVPWDLHAVERVRSLFSQALEYPLPTGTGDYGLDKNQFVDIVPRERHVLFLHGTTRADKHWPEQYWQHLCKRVCAAGFRVLLPWGNAIEHERAQRIAAAGTNAAVLPRQNLVGLASLIATSSAVVAVDTGLGHLSAALDVPTVSLYGATDPARIGTYGMNQVHLDARQLPAISATLEPRTMAPLTPPLVWNALQPLLQNPQ